MTDREYLIKAWAEIDRLRNEANRLERALRKRHDDCIMLNKLERFVDKHIVPFSVGFIMGIAVVLIRMSA
jgi:hypothetical protein